MNVLGSFIDKLFSKTSRRILKKGVTDSTIHYTAIVDEGATIGSGCRIWHWVHIGGGARIGNDCSLGQNVYVGKNVVMGNHVKIQNNVSIYDAVQLEDDVFCGPSMVFTNVHNPRSHVIRKNEFKPTLVKKGASIGANATIVCGHVIGEYAFVGAGAVVTRDVPPYAIMMGVPARIAGWMCQCGEKINNTGHCTACEKTYDITNGGCRLLTTPQDKA